MDNKIMLAPVEDNKKCA